MAKHAEDPRKNEQTHHDSDVPPRKKRRFLFRFFRVMVILTVVLLLINVLIGFLYHGPRTMADVVQAMPGVPLFPLADITKTNRLAQRAYTLPLLFMRLQGAEKAEFAQLQAPADNFFIVDWYRRSLPTMGWDFYGQQRLYSATRLIFIREHEGLQVMVGESHDIQTPIQLIYLAGLPRRQLVQLMHALPRGARAVPPPLGIRNSDKPQQKPTPQPTTGGR
ncbi:MAG TPA: hypothetical protein VHV83_07165 [Armatimonadota bacterium]|nr:hypothetical protein [Armatimonadota bacterium]